MRRRTFLRAVSLPTLGTLAGCATKEGSRDASPTREVTTDHATPAPTTTPESDVDAEQTDDDPAETTDEPADYPPFPVPPEASESSQVLSMFDQRRRSDPGLLPAGLTPTGYAISATPGDVVDWYETSLGDWTQVSLDESRGVRGFYRNGDAGAQVLVMPSPMDSGESIVITAVGSWHSLVDRDALRLDNLAVSFGPFDPETGRAGDVDFHRTEGFIEPVLPFGSEIEGENGPKTVPEIEFWLAPDAEVTAVADGVVTAVEWQEDPGDYSVIIKPAPDSPWMIDQDHVSDPRVAVGDRVSAGEVIGGPGVWSDSQGRTEVQVANVVGTSYCPLLFMDADVRADYEAKIERVRAAWADYSGTTLDDGFAPGCASETAQNG